jgi:cellobiose phosphorylase
MTTYGYFDDAAREYVITDPRTPVKWINYIGTLAFGGFVDQTGGALLCVGDPALNRITRYVAQMPAGDFRGTTLYLRIKEPAGYRVFSPFFVPTLDRYERYECHVGLGYTRIVSEFYDLRTDVTIFVPRGDDVEIRDIAITNLSAEPREVDAIPVVEYSHFDALKQFTNADWVPQTMQSRAYHEEKGRLLLTQYAFMRRDTCLNYFTSDGPVSSFTSDRRRFLGHYEYGTWAAPLSLQAPELDNYEAHRGDNVAALLHRLGVLAPGQSIRLITQLGQAPDVAACRNAAARYLDGAAVDQAKADLAAFWDAYLAALHVETPDPAMNSMLNIHNPRQCYTTLTWSRYLSLYQLGYGARGIGFRDSSQDIMGALASAPDEARALLRKLLSVQKSDGSAMHQFNPLTMIGEVGDSAEVLGAPKYYSDDHLWIVLAVCAYLKETGNLSFLAQVIPYYDQRGDAPADGASDGAVRPAAMDDEEAYGPGCVLDHLRRAITFTQGDLGAHGLPRLGFADWNDTINLPSGAESGFTANLYGRGLRELAELVAHLGFGAETAGYLAAFKQMKARVNDCAWDGAWYVRYFDANGSPLGSHANPAGQIYINAQSWAVISGFVTPERAHQAMASVHERLNTRYGLKLSAPGFNGYDPASGGITTYPPGAKENGGLFLHTNPWAMIAETMLSHGDRAYEYYRQINPAARNDATEVYECEPYVYAQNILGDEHPQFGLARNSWLSGTASWTYQAATQYILGLRPHYRGLQIDPCIPAAWDGYTATRRFRGCTYNITVRNPRHICRGVTQLTVDGQVIEGNFLPIFDAGESHTVEVTLGQI